MIRNYENLTIFDPEVGEEKIDSDIEDLKKVITKGKGEIFSVEKWGLREFAYPINKKKQGFYVLTYFKLDPKGLKKVYEKFKFDENIMRYIIVARPAREGEKPKEESKEK